MTRSPLLAAWIAVVATAGEACELPGGAAQRIESPHHVVLYRAQPAPRVGEHFALESLSDDGGNCRARVWRRLPLK
jgi:hypothetical protein